MPVQNPHRHVPARPRSSLTLVPHAHASCSCSRSGHTLTPDAQRAQTLLHNLQLIINTAIQKRPPLTDQLRLQSLLDQRPHCRPQDVSAQVYPSSTIFPTSSPHRLQRLEKQDQEKKDIPCFLVTVSKSTSFKQILIASTIAPSSGPVVDR